MFKAFDIISFITIFTISIFIYRSLYGIWKLSTDAINKKSVELKNKKDILEAHKKVKEFLEISPDKNFYILENDNCKVVVNNKEHVIKLINKINENEEAIVDNFFGYDINKIFNIICGFFNSQSDYAEILHKLKKITGFVKEKH